MVALGDDILVPIAKSTETSQKEKEIKRGNEPASTKPLRTKLGCGQHISTQLHPLHLRNGVDELNHMETRQR